MFSHVLDSIHVWTKIARNPCTGLCGPDIEAVKPETIVEKGWHQVLGQDPKSLQRTRFAHIVLVGVKHEEPIF